MDTYSSANKKEGLGRLREDLAGLGNGYTRWRGETDSHLRTEDRMAARAGSQDFGGAKAYAREHYETGGLPSWVTLKWLAAGALVALAVGYWIRR